MIHAKLAAGIVPTLAKKHRDLPIGFATARIAVDAGFDCDVRGCQLLQRRAKFVDLGDGGKLSRHGISITSGWGVEQNNLSTSARRRCIVAR